VADGACFFVTVCAKTRGGDELIRDGRGRAILDAVKYLNGRQSWFARLFLIMPDHVHGLISFPSETGMQKRTASWKGYLAKSTGIEWQDRFFDHRLRSEDSMDEKAQYIRLNPVRAGLVKCVEEWPWVFDAYALDHGSAGTPRPTSEISPYV
jgi:REP element-mobilizing transposase RayT